MGRFEALSDSEKPVDSPSRFSHDYQKNLEYARGWIRNFTPQNPEDLTHPYKFRVELVNSLEKTYKMLVFSYKPPKYANSGTIAQHMMINMDHAFFLREMKRLYGVYKQIQRDFENDI